nr:MAG TPA: Regulatory protein-modification, helix-turn-helix, transcriptional regulator, DNA [Bacteriophage sp.]
MQNINKNFFMSAITEVGLSVKEVSEKLNISKTALYRKINNKSEFTYSEIKILKEIISDEKFKKIFLI